MTLSRLLGVFSTKNAVQEAPNVVSIPGNDESEPWIGLIRKNKRLDKVAVALGAGGLGGGILVSLLVVVGSC